MILKLDSLEVTVTELAGTSLGAYTITDGYALFYDTHEKKVFVAMQYGGEFGKWYDGSSVRIKPPFKWSNVPPPMPSTPWIPLSPYIQELEPFIIRHPSTMPDLPPTIQCKDGGCGR